MDDDQSDPNAAPREPSPTRRRALMLGAVGAASVVSIRPALAQTVGSVLTCEIPMPQGKAIDQYGKVVPANTAGAYNTPVRPLKGQDVKTALSNGTTLPGVPYDASRAYLKYVQSLQRGTAGFTCFASLQMLRR